MLGKEEEASNARDVGKNASSSGPCQLSSGRKHYWRSASWSSSRSSLPPLIPENDNKDGNGPSINRGNNNSGISGQARIIPPPLTPRSSQHSFKGRSFLPPLAIARRSLDEWPKAGSDDIGEWPLPCTPSGRGSNNGGERLKLDLSNIQRDSDNNCGRGLVKREKIAFFDKECSKVDEHIYLGGDGVARDREILLRNGITHVLNCVGFVCPEYFQADFVYRTLWLQDSPSEDITSILYDVFDYFEDVREQRGRVFVHCCQGVSRSTSLVIAYLMWREGQSFDDAFQYVKSARGIADPNMGFSFQLLQCQKRVHAFPLSPSSSLRVYRMAPHSPYDPLHLVPKILNDPSPNALDSRGAFIVHIPSAIYVWIGKNCESVMERDARGAACQIVRYEKVQGPILCIKEGEEPSYFWDAFSNVLQLMDKSSDVGNGLESSNKIGVGERKVEKYNFDFDIFQRASIGGFAPPFASSETEHETLLPVRESCWSVLKRKFVSRNTKDFVSASKSGVSKVYPDSSSFVVDPNPTVKMSNYSTSLLMSCKPLTSLSSSLSSVSLSLSSSSSSPHLSPESFSSDSSNISTNSSGSPAASPLALSCSNLTASCLSGFSDLSLHSPKISPHSISKSSKYIDVNFTSQQSSHTNSSPSRRTPLSIAERRGSLSKLQLPLSIDSHPNKDSPISGEIDFVNLSKSTLLEECDIFQHRRRIHENGGSELAVFSGKVTDDDTIHNKTDILIDPDKPRGNNSSGEKDPCVLDGMMDHSLAACNLVKPIVCRWPSLERLAAFGTAGLDSKSVFILITPSLGSGNVEDRILYVWVGRSFNCNRTETILGCEKLGDVEEIDWKLAISDDLHQMGLPRDIKIKIIKENEEPAEFLALLGSL